MTDKWIPYTTSPVKGNQFTIKGLELGKAYQARIRTVNQGAHSRWYYLKSNLLAAETLSKLIPCLESIKKLNIFSCS